MRLTTKLITLVMAMMLSIMSIPFSSQAQANQPDSKLSAQASANELTAQYLAAPDQNPTIVCDQTIQGSIDLNDQSFQGGIHYDLYTTTTQQANQPFIVTAQATNFPVAVELYYFDPQFQQFMLQQVHFTNIRNGQIQFSGVFATAGQYGIVVEADTAQNTGPYTVKLECRACGAATGDCSTGGTRQNPVAIQLNQQLSCQLTANDETVLNNGQTFYAKFFALQHAGGQITVNVTTSAFTPSFLIVDPPGESPGIYTFPGTQNFPAGRLVIGVTSRVPDQPQRTGAFTIQITGGGTPPTSDCSTGGRISTPVAIQIGQTLSCQLTANDESLNANNMTFYGKFFGFQTQGGTLNVNVNSTAFTPQLLIVDPPGNAPGIYTISGPLQLPSGQYVIGVTSSIPGQPQRTGAFTIQITGN
jgi:hypothetical protein